MKTQVGYGILTVAMCLGGCATTTTHPSPYFKTVAEHLDLGGEVFVYADIEGDLTTSAESFDRILQKIRKVYPDTGLEKLKAKRLLGQMGLDELLAFGLSSTQDGKIFHNKAFLHHKNPRRGLLLLTGSPPRDLEVTRQAPGDSDVVFESDLRLKTLFDLVESIMMDIDPSEARKILANIDDKIPGTTLSSRQLFQQLDTRMVGVLRIDPKKNMVVPIDGKSITIPSIDLLVSVDNMAILFDAVKEAVRENPLLKPSSNGDFQLIEVGIPFPDAPWLKPVLAKNLKNGRLFLATSMAFVKEFLADKTTAKQQLAQAPDFKAATDGFSDRANSLSYISGAFIPKVTTFLAPFGKEDAKVQTAIDFVQELLPEAGIPYAAQQVNLPDGLYHTSNTTTSHKTTLFSSLAAGPIVLAGVVVSAMTSAFRHFL
jgi:hypothetical protein